MHNVREIAQDTWYIGVNDNKTGRFENLHPLPEGVTYNSYMILLLLLQFPLSMLLHQLWFFAMS